MKPPSNCTCGKANKKTKIVNGVETEENEYPWQVGLKAVGGGGMLVFCGGSIISKKDILTAAHCTQNTQPGDIYIWVGGHNKYNDPAYVFKTVCSIKIHESYDNNTYNYDVAILTLCDELEFSEKIAPVCTPSAQSLGYEYEGLDHVVSGWGLTSEDGDVSQVLMETTVKTMKNEQCFDMYGSQITNYMMCAYKLGTDACQGDSGGPLVTKDPAIGKYIQTGVVSWGTGCALPNYSGVYARVSKFVDWMKWKAEEDLCSA